MQQNTLRRLDLTEAFLDGNRGGNWHLFEIFKSTQLTVKISLAMNDLVPMRIGIRRDETPLLLDIFEMVSCGMFFVRALDLAGHGL